MSAGVTLLIVLATLAFGAVYPWAYLPLFAAAACIGAAGLIWERRVPSGARRIAAGLLLVTIVVGAQLVPIPRGTLDLVSPHVANLLSRYSLTFAAGTGPHPLSINPGATAIALLGVAGLGLYLIGLSGVMSHRDLRTLPRTLILFAVPLALLGIYGREHNNGLVYGFWQPQEGSNANGFGPFVNRNHFAAWMLMTTCLAIGVLCGRLERALDGAKFGLRERVVWLSSSEANRIILIAASISVMTISLVWTMSRSGIVSFVCAVVCFSWVIIKRRHGERKGRIVVVTTLAAVVLAGLSWRGLDNLTRWFTDTRDFESRVAAWHDGWRVVRDFPISGTGINTYPDAMIFYQRNVREFWMTHAHNDYLQLLAEGGLLVCIPAAITMGLLAVTISGRLKEVRNDSYAYWVRMGAGVGLIAIGIQETVEFSLHIPANALLFVTLAALAMAPIKKQSQPMPQKYGARHHGTDSSGAETRVPSIALKVRNVGNLTRVVSGYHPSRRLP